MCLSCSVVLGLAPLVTVGASVRVACRYKMYCAVGLLDCFGWLTGWCTYYAVGDDTWQHATCMSMLLPFLGVLGLSLHLFLFMWSSLEWGPSCARAPDGGGEREGRNK